MGGVQRRDLDIVNKRGLHARAAARFVKEAARYKAAIRVSKDGTEVSGRSIVGLMMLAAAQGSAIHVVAEGPDAAEALEALAALVARRFDEGE